MRDSGRQHWRLLVVTGLFSALALVVVAKLFHVQVVRQDYYREMALQLHWQKEIIPARRGAIRASDGQPLAVSVDYETLYAVPQRVQNPPSAADKLAPLLGESAADMRARLTGSGDAPVAIKRGLSAETADRVRALRIGGLSLRPEPSREYPEAPLAAQLLGFVGRDHQGLAGLEVGQEDVLAGRPGVIYAERDTGGEEIALGQRVFEPAMDGASLVLTIDRFAQRVVESELDAAMAKHRPANVTIIVIEPRTGGILAMGSRPSYDPRDAKLLAAGDSPLFRVPELVDVYEPGSVFKIFTMSAGIDAGTVTPETTVNCPGYFTYGGITVRTWDLQAHGVETMLQGLERSCNVALATVSTRLGAGSYYRYLRAFGFGQPTGVVGLPGDATGIVRAPDSGTGWADADLATNAFGQGVAVTSLQLATAAAGIANGGQLMRPQIVRETWGSQGRQTIRAEATRRVISASTARTMREMMVSVVEASPSHPAIIPGYRVAGKTGTAELPTAQGYSRVETIATFAGFVPADDPAFAIVVKVERPQDSPWGEIVAAPIFKHVAVPLLAHWRIPPTVPISGGRS